MIEASDQFPRGLQEQARDIGMEWLVAG